MSNDSETDILGPAYSALGVPQWPGQGVLHTVTWLINVYYVSGPAYSALGVSQWPGQGVLQQTQYIHDVVKRSDHLRLLCQVEREVSEIRRILLQPAARSDATGSARTEPDC